MVSLFDMNGHQQNEFLSDDEDFPVVDNRFGSRRCKRICENLCGKIKRRKTEVILLSMSFFLIVAATSVSIRLGAYAYFVVKPERKIDFTLSAFAIPNHPAWIRWNAWKNAFRGWRERRSVETSPNFYETDGHRKSSRAKRSTESCYRIQTQQSLKISVVYLAQGGGSNIFTRNRIGEIHDIEKKIRSVPGYEDFCLKNAPACGCFPVNSILTYFYPSLTPDGDLLYDGNGSEMMDIDVALNYALSSSPASYWFTDGRISADFHESRFIRSEIRLGAPLEGYNDFSFDRVDEQRSKLLEFAIKQRDELKKASTESVRVLYGGTELFDHEVSEVFWNDLRMSIVSGASVVVFMFVLTSFSVWLTFWGIAAILLSFPLAFFLYRVAFDIVNIGLLNGIAVFLIIGIGVDDVFVFINTFRQLDHVDDLRKRIYRTTLTAGKATFFTSSTTAAAFAANAASSIPAVHQFGLFMALIVTCCWLLVVLILPPVIIIWHLCFVCCEKACCTCCKKCKARKTIALPNDVAHFLSGPESGCPRSTETVPQDSEDDTLVLLQCDERAFTPGVLHMNTDDDDDGDDDDPLLLLEEEIQTSLRAEAKKRDGCDLNSWFQGLLYRYVAIPVVKARVAIAVLFVALLIVSVGCFSQIRFATKAPQLFRPDSNLQMFFDLMANYSKAYTSCDECSGFSLTSPVPKVPTISPLRTPAASSTTRAGGQTSFQRGASTQQHSSLAPSAETATHSMYPSASRQVFPGSSTPALGVRSSTARTSSEAVSGQSGNYRNVTLNPCDGGRCKDIEDHPPLEAGITVYVVFGIKGFNQSAEHVLAEEGTTIYDDEFYGNYRLPDLNLTDLCRVCKKIIGAADLVLPNTSQCWPSGLAHAEALMANGGEECKDVPRMYQDEKGKWQQTQLHVGLGSEGIRWLSFSFRANTYEGQSSFVAYEKYQKWEALIKSIVDDLAPDSPLRSMYQTSEFWKQVMMEVVAVSSAIYGLVLSMLICVLAVGVFTGHLGLLLITVVTMIGLVSLVLAIFFWAGWELGAIEAVSLSILIGSSVDYCMHIVEGYNLAGKCVPSENNASVRRWRAKVAVTHIGTSVVSSALTTIMAAIPLTGTMLVPFSRFGQIVAINTTVSIAYALTACVALLGLFAPAKFTHSLRSVAKMMVAMAVFTGGLFLVLFIVSRCGVDIPAPNGNDLFPK